MATIELMVMDACGRYEVAAPSQVLAAARSIIDDLVPGGTALDSPGKVKEYLQVKLSGLEHEVFSALFVDAQNRLIAYVEMFRGTLTQTSVYPREVVKEALAHNACAVIFAHNHPSGLAEPSAADMSLTRQLQTALALVDVKVLDHFVVGGAKVVSFAEKGLL